MDLRTQQTELETLVGDILAEARKQGADQAEVSVSLDQGLGVSVRQGELEQVEFNQDKGFGITVYFGQRKGSASTTDSRPDAIAQTVAAAADIAKYTEEDDCSGLADPELMPDGLEDLDLFHPWEIEPDQAEALALECEAAGLSLDPNVSKSDGAQVNNQQSLRVYGNSHGFVGAYAGTRQGLSCVLIGEDNSGMQRDYWYTVSRRADQLDDAASVGRKAAERTAARMSPRKAQTGTFPVLFSPPLASGLFGHLMGAISGGALYRKSSFLLDSLGEQVLPEWLSLIERPHLRCALGSANFDGDGVATSEKAFIEQGKVANYILSSYSARKLGLQTTGNAGGVFNLDVDSTQPGLGQTELLQTLGTGLWVTELMGQGVNGVTGDYSRGAAGFWVENGQVQYPVAEVTVAGNLKDMYHKIEALGDDVDYRNNTRAPSVLIRDLTLAGE
ncbi:MAG: metalloprotease PmbA [Pseudomonadota bacterium]